MAELYLLQKISYGAQAEFWARYRDKAWSEVVREQLAGEDNSPDLDKRLQALRLPIKYNHKGQKVEEERPLRYLYQPPESLFSQLLGKDTHRRERTWPAFELMAATAIRAQHSPWQLREMLVEFWHNHFNVNAQGDERIALSMPEHDRRIRQNALGNFRVLLESMAKSPAMLYYLHNYQSKASPANENYARELFELHTLGAEHYYNHLYNRWREVPGATEGKPIGYIDEDVYEAARAFTGWTVGDGSKLDRGQTLPLTGEFMYYEAWHDHYQKRVLGREFPPNQAPMADGQQVLDLLAEHLGTAKHICRKLCRRFYGDEVPEALLNRATKVWREQRQSPQQLRLVLEAILLALPDFPPQPKLKRPWELLMSFLRATGIELRPNEHLLHLLENCGQAPFSWPTPTGHPDEAAHWLGDTLLLNRWNLLATLLSHDWHKAAKVDLEQRFASKDKTLGQTIDFWLGQFFPDKVPDKLRQRALSLYGAGGDEEDLVHAHNEAERLYRLQQSLLLFAYHPDFQYR